MADQERKREGAAIRLGEDDVAYLMNLLRNAAQPVATQELIDALRRHSGEVNAGADGGE